MNFKYQISTEESIDIYVFEGKITSELDYEELEKEVHEGISKGRSNIIFDMEKLTHTNSSGISFFMRTLTKSRILGGELVLCNIMGNVEKIFAISKLDEIYTICTNQMEAINHFKK